MNDVVFWLCLALVLLVWQGRYEYDPHPVKSMREDAVKIIKYFTELGR